MDVERLFPSDDEVTRWIERYVLLDVPGDPRVDQLRAANRDNEDMFMRLASNDAVRDQAENVHFDVEMSQGKLRGIVRMLMMVEAVHAEPLCEHVDLLVPLLVSCDPPTVCCQKPTCLREGFEVQQKLPFRWNNSCDHCGKTTDKLARCILTFGRMTVLAHVCRGCTVGLNAL